MDLGQDVVIVAAAAPRQRVEAPVAELGIVPLDRRGSDAQPVAAHVRAAGDEAAARQGDDLVPAVLPDRM